MYCGGAIENIRLASIYFPDWICRFYVSSDCPAISVLRNMNCEVVEMPPQKGIDRREPNWKWNIEHIGMFWRYFIIDELKDGDCAIFRDTDSRLSKRDSDCVNDWLASPYLAHRIHECQAHHNSWAMGGLFGVRGGVLSGVKESIEKWVEYYKRLNHDYIFIDLLWLTNVLGPIINPSTIGYGYGHVNELPSLEKEEDMLGWVVNDHLRYVEFKPGEYKSE